MRLARRNLFWGRRLIQIQSACQAVCLFFEDLPTETFIILVGPRRDTKICSGDAENSYARRSRFSRTSYLVQRIRFMVCRGVRIPILNFVRIVTFIIIASKARFYTPLLLIITGPLFALWTDSSFQLRFSPSLSLSLFRRFHETCTFSSKIYES